MDLQTRFRPPRRAGVLFNLAGFVILGGAAALVFLQVYQQGSGAEFVFGLLLAGLLVLPLPLIAYRAYALFQGEYILDRDGLRLRWGLRWEDIPLPDIEWVRPANELGFRLPLPFLQWPGAILGTRRVEGLGMVEFVAGDFKSLLLVATPHKVYAITPADGRSFLRTFRQIVELGSLTPITSLSVRPVVFYQQVWNDRLGRGLLLGGLALTLLLFVMAGLVIPGRTSVSLGYDPQRQPLEPISAERLLLLPVLSGLAYAVDTIVGLFFYRKVEQHPAAYVVWASSLITPFMLLLAILFM